jgi:hypothetical protein
LEFSQGFAVAQHCDRPRGFSSMSAEARKSKDLERSQFELSDDFGSDRRSGIKNDRTEKDRAICSVLFGIGKIATSQTAISSRAQMNGNVY